MPNYLFSSNTSIFINFLNHLSAAKMYLIVSESNYIYYFFIFNKKCLLFIRKYVNFKDLLEKQRMRDDYDAIDSFAFSIIQ